MSIHEPLKEFSVRRVSRDAGGPDIRALAEVQNKIFTLFVDELNIGEVNVEPADLEEVHTVLSEPPPGSVTTNHDPIEDF